LNPAPTPSELRAAIDAIVEEQRRSASASPYDWKVCVMAVGAAAAALDRVPVAGTAADYAAHVLAALTALRDTYDDPSGERQLGDRLDRCQGGAAGAGVGGLCSVTTVIVEKTVRGDVTPSASCWKRRRRARSGCASSARSTSCRKPSSRR